MATELVAGDDPAAVIAKLREELRAEVRQRGLAEQQASSCTEAWLAVLSKRRTSESTAEDIGGQNDAVHLIELGRLKLKLAERDQRVSDLESVQTNCNKEIAGQKGTIAILRANNSELEARLQAVVEERDSEVNLREAAVLKQAEESSRNACLASEEELRQQVVQLRLFEAANVRELKLRQALESQDLELKEVSASLKYHRGALFEAKNSTAQLSSKMDELQTKWRYEVVLRAALASELAQLRARGTETSTQTAVPIVPPDTALLLHLSGAKPEPAVASRRTPLNTIPTNCSKDEPHNETHWYTPVISVEQIASARMEATRREAAKRKALLYAGTRRLAAARAQPPRPPRTSTGDVPPTAVGSRGLEMAESRRIKASGNFWIGRQLNVPSTNVPSTAAVDAKSAEVSAAATTAARFADRSSSRLPSVASPLLALLLDNSAAGPPNRSPSRGTT
jgi:hypothetical protein